MCLQFSDASYHFISRNPTLVHFIGTWQCQAGSRSPKFGAWKMLNLNHGRIPMMKHETWVGQFKFGPRCLYCQYIFNVKYEDTSNLKADDSFVAFFGWSGPSVDRGPQPQAKHRPSADSSMVQKRPQAAAWQTKSKACQIKWRVNNLNTVFWQDFPWIFSQTPLSLCVIQTRLPAALWMSDIFAWILVLILC